MMNYNQYVEEGFSAEYIKTLKQNQQYDHLIDYLLFYSKNNTSAMNELAHCFYYGIGVEKNWQKVFEYNQRAAKLEDINGISYLGYDYLYGVGVDINYTMEFGTKDETMVSAQIVGIFKLAGNVEKDQPEATTAINRIENQVFVDNDTYMDLIKEPVFDKVSIYSKNPENLGAFL